MNWKEEKDFLLLYYALWTKRTKELAEEKIQKIVNVNILCLWGFKEKKKKT